MYVNQIDEIIDNILNNFNIFLIDKNIFNKIKQDINFVIYQLDILNCIDTFIKSLPRNEILQVIKNENNYNIIINIIKRYCAYDIFLGLAYYYNGSRDLYITNIIEISRYQKDAIIQIPDFFNSENNSKLVIYYNDIKNLLSLLQLKTIDKIKIILFNNIVKYDSTIKLFNDLGEDYIIDNFIIPNNFHNIIKTIIFSQLYLKEDRSNIMTILNNIEKDNAEYIYIDIVIPNTKKIVDISVIQKFLTLDQLKYGLAEDIYDYLESYKTLNINSIDNINLMFNKKIFIPITEDFLRYHKDTEKYDNENIGENIKNKDITKIKYITNKMTAVTNYYSPLLLKNPKLKIETENYFFKPLQPRMAVLYNNIEEVKIIQKLNLSQNATDADLLVDLINIKKYAYVNFKSSTYNVLKMRPNNTISCVRNTNILSTHKSSLELRIGNDNIDINIIGIILNPLMKSLNCFTTDDLEKINKHDTDGFKIFVKTLLSSFKVKKYNKLYYWIFNNKTDKPQFKTYVDYGSSDDTHNILLMLNEIFNYYIELVVNDINTKLSKFTELNLWYFEKILKYYKNKYYDLSIIKNNILPDIYFDKIKEYDIIISDDYKQPQNIIKLPNLNIKQSNINIIKLRETIISIDTENIKNIPTCHHYIKWANIHKLSKKTNDFNQAIYNFVKTYVRVNESGDYICKSCSEFVPLYKFEIEGTYNEEQDEFLTTSMGFNQKLEDIPRYQKYIKSIRNIDKNIERFCYLTDLVYYLGNTPIPRLKRRLITKDIIDLILIHTEWLKNQPKNRIQLSLKKYGINPELTNLFFFELKDEIFLTSSLDTDYYKLIKYNNIIAYMIIIIISEINAGQIINLKNDKTYNYLFFTKVFNTLFGDLYLRIGQKEKIVFNKLPVLSYVIYYFSGILISKKLWLYNDTNEKSKILNYINLQKSIIHTVIDLLNTIYEASTDNLHGKEKNYLYEIINTRLLVKNNYIFNDTNILLKVSEKFNKNILYDESTKKLQFIQKKIPLIDIKSSQYNLFTSINNNRCDLDTVVVINKNIDKFSNKFNVFTNCNDGSFHNWIFVKNDLICSLCNVSYNDLVSHNKSKLKSNTIDTSYLDKLKMINLQKLSLKYCINGDVHKFDTSGKCMNCGLYANKINLNQKSLLTLEQNLNNKYNELSIININNSKKLNEKIINSLNKTINNINDFNKLFDKNNAKNIESYINNFITILSNILGNKITIKDTTFYLNDTVYIINHDYLGSHLKNNIIILSSENKMIIQHNHKMFNISVIYYKYKNIYVYYDLITLQYLGYSDDNKVLKTTQNNASLIIELSLKESLLYLGYENQYYNLYHINTDFNNNFNDTEIIMNLIRNRINNLRQIITRTYSIIYNIKHKNNIVNKSIKNDEKNIIHEFIDKIQTLNTNDLFNNNDIINKINIDNNIPNIKLTLSKHYIDLQYIVNLVNTDTKLLFYYIHNLINLLNNNNNNISTQTELAFLIIKIIKYLFNLYYRPYNNYNIRKFDYQLINDVPFIDESLRIVGNYLELLTVDEINNYNVIEEKYNNNEEKNSLDIDEYEINDDIDESMEALESFEL